jgi:membrane-associated protease RseP (regulator of RpoE activity)
MNLYRLQQLGLSYRAGRMALLALLILAASASAKAQKGYVGAFFDFLDPMTSSQYGLNMGAVLVRNVVPGGPAESSGLRPGDIITSVDGIPMSGPQQVVDAFRAHKPGDKARVGIIHPMGSNHMSLEIMVTIGRWPSNGPPSGPPQTGPDSGYNPGNAPSRGNNGQWNQAPQGGGWEQPRGNQAGHGSGGGQPRPVQVQMTQQGPCRAAVFPGWQLVPGQNGQSADIGGPNGAHVGWAITGINPAQRQFYGDIYGPPEAHVAALISSMLHAQTQFISANNVGNFFTAHQFRAGYTTGVVLYHVYPAQMGQYIISEYFAWAQQGDDELLSQAEAMMTTLQCTASIRPPSPSIYEPPKGDHKRSTGSAEGDSLKDYNSILGTQYAHDPSTGQTYRFSRDQVTNGPEGEGYYVGTGVNRHMLTPGLE